MTEPRQIQTTCVAARYVMPRAIRDSWIAGRRGERRGGLARESRKTLRGVDGQNLRACPHHISASGNYLITR